MGKKKLPQKTNGQVDRHNQQVWVLVSGQFAVSADQEERTKVWPTGPWDDFFHN